MKHPKIILVGIILSFFGLFSKVKAVGVADSNAITGGVMNVATRSPKFVGSIVLFILDKVSVILQGAVSLVSTTLSIPEGQAGVLVTGIGLIVVTWKLNALISLFEGTLRYILGGIAILMIVVGLGVI